MSLLSIIAQARTDATADDAAAALGVLFLLWVAVAIGYWLPTIVAAVRGVNLGRVLVLNTLIGWTVIGWFVAMGIALGRRSSLAP